MDLIAILWQFFCLWGVIYVLVITAQLVRRRKFSRKPTFSADRQASGILPLDIRDAAQQTEEDQWHVSLFQVRYTTQKCNGIFARISKAAPRFWHAWFSIGAVVGVLVMAVGLFVIGYAALKIVNDLVHALIASARTTRHVKRAIQTENDEQVFLPMIPGITVPLSHFGYYLFALLICGVFHEAGHAIASYCEMIPIRSAGIFVYYIYPGAFVNIPDQPLQLLAPFRQLKIICAGVWHNIVLYLWVMALLSGGLKASLQLMGWKSLEGSGGVSVVSVREDSPLAHHLTVSSVIYQLDDYYLERNIQDWNAYLLEQQQGLHVLQRGFCAVVDHDDTGVGCCDLSETYPFGRSSNASVSCFRNFVPDPGSQRPLYMSCLATAQTMVSADAVQCLSDADCPGGENSKCVMPYTPSLAGQVVRIHVRLPKWSQQPDLNKVFVFEGDPADIWESVTVGILQPRTWVLPVSLPHVSELLLRYISSFTLALALLNILPAFHLDGEFALAQLYELVMVRTGQQNPVSTQGGASQRYARRIVKITSAIVGFVIVGSILFGLAGQQT